MVNSHVERHRNIVRPSESQLAVASKKRDPIYDFLHPDEDTIVSSDLAVYDSHSITDALRGFRKKQIKSHRDQPNFKTIEGKITNIEKIEPNHLYQGKRQLTEISIYSENDRELYHLRIPTENCNPYLKENDLIMVEGLIHPCSKDCYFRRSNTKPKDEIIKITEGLSIIIPNSPGIKHVHNPKICFPISPYNNQTKKTEKHPKLK